MALSSVNSTKRGLILYNIASLLILHEDESDQRGNNSNVPALEKTTSNEAYKRNNHQRDQHFVKPATISAEICWVLIFVPSKCSMNSSCSSDNLSFVLFQESDIAKWFQFGHSEAGYVAYFALAPYCHELVFSKLSGCSYIALSFEESSNSSIQKGQMVIIIQFCDLETICVLTHYLGLEIMGRVIAEQFLQTFPAKISNLDQTTIPGCIRWPECECSFS